MSAIRFDDRVVIVTGAGNGLGRSYALELGRRGAAVVVNDLGGDAHGGGASRVADEVVEQIVSAGGTAVADYSSVATRDGGEAIVRSALDSFGRVDGLISNAGILRNAMFENLTEGDIDAVLDVHLKGAFNVAQPAYRVMKQQGYGRILLTSSASGAFGYPTQANYGAAKAGLIGLTNVLAFEGRPHGVLCNALLPLGTTRLMDAMGDEYDYGQLSPSGMELLAPACVPEFTAPLAVYLVSEANTATHGLYSSIAGRYACTFIGVGPGWYHPGDLPPSAEDIAGHWAEIEQRDGFSEPLDNAEEFVPVIELARRHRDQR